MTAAPNGLRTGGPLSGSGTLTDDAAELGRQTRLVDDLIGSLPSKPTRTADQQAAADQGHEFCRRLRGTFISRHGAAVYCLLTDDLAQRPRLDALVAAAARRFPGLVPDETQLAAEFELPQSDREGREIDQGIFFGGIFGDPVSGTHLLESMLRPSEQAVKLLPEFEAADELDLGPVRIDRVGETAHVTIQNLDALNAEDNALVQALETAVDLVLLDPRVRTGVLRGAEMTHPRYAGRRVFSAGINLKHLHQGRISFVDFLLGRETGFISKIYRGLLVDDPNGTTQQLEKAWIAAVDSFAIGGGAQLVLVFDHVLAASDSYFSLPAAQEGIVPGVSNLRLTRMAGGRVARQVILGGRRIGATEPAAALFFDEVVPPEEMDRVIAERATELAAPAVVPNRHMINHSEEPLDVFRHYLAEFSHQQALRLYSADVIDKVGRRPGAGG